MGSNDPATSDQRPSDWRYPDEVAKAEKEAAENKRSAADAVVHGGAPREGEAVDPRGKVADVRPRTMGRMTVEWDGTQTSTAGWPGESPEDTARIAELTKAAGYPERLGKGLRDYEESDLTNAAKHAADGKGVACNGYEVCHYPHCVDDVEGEKHCHGCPVMKATSDAVTKAGTPVTAEERPPTDPFLRAAMGGIACHGLFFAESTRRDCVYPACMAHGKCTSVARTLTPLEELKAQEGAHEAQLKAALDDYYAGKARPVVTPEKPPDASEARTLALAWTTADRNAEALSRAQDQLAEAKADIDLLRVEADRAQELDAVVAELRAQLARVEQGAMEIEITGLRATITDLREEVARLKRTIGDAEDHDRSDDAQIAGMQSEAFEVTGDLVAVAEQLGFGGVDGAEALAFLRGWVAGRTNPPVYGGRS